jgi:ribonuclease HI
MRYYVVISGRKTGIFNNWKECRENVIGYKGSLFKSFLTMKDAQCFLDVKSRKRTDEKSTEVIEKEDKIDAKGSLTGYSLQSSEILRKGKTPIPVQGKSIIYTAGSTDDGSSGGGAGGYGVLIIKPNGCIDEYYGPYPTKKSNNQQNTLYAIYCALHLCKDDCLIKTNNKYAITCMSELMDTWIANNFEGIKNTELIRATYAAIGKRKVEFKFINRDDCTTDIFNERVKRLACMGKDQNI